MEYQEYINEKKELYVIILQFIEDENTDDYSYENLLNTIEAQHICLNKEELTLFIRLLIQIANNHHRHIHFLNNIKKIFQYLFRYIKINYTNSEIFRLCKSNKIIILFLIKEKILIVDEDVTKEILYRSKKTNTKYHQFFYPEIREFLDKYELKEIDQDIIEEDPTIFEYKRNIGENDNYICELVRNDSIVDFISYTNQANIQLSKTIESTAYETNSLLLKKEPTLIEYAAFYGSIQILQYLKMNNVELSSSLWIYAIHSKNPEIIHFLEENLVEPPDETYKVCLNESIKCHHNDIANYIKDVFLNDENDYKPIFQYYNFLQFPENMKNNFIFYYLCRYNYSNLIDLYIQPKKENLIENIKV